MEKLNELVEQAKFVADWHGSDWSSALCQGKDGKQAHEIICESRGEAVISTGSNSNEASWLCDYLELCSPTNILAIAEAFRALEQQRDALAAENTNLLPKAASELSNAWVLHKYWIGINAALMHMQVGRSYEAEQWLKGTIAGPGLEAPNLKLSDEIDAWANEQGKDSISHLRALEIIKAEAPATDAYLNSVRAEGVEMFASKATLEGSTFRIALAGFAAELRAGKDGE